MSRGPETESPVVTGEQGDEVLAALRSYAAVSAEISRQFAVSLGLHPTDAAALIEILEAEERDMPLSPARLSERIGLTSGATSSLLNRLEDAGHIVRSRERSDRRIVTLRSTPGVEEVAAEFFDPLEVSLGSIMSAYPDNFLKHVKVFLEELRSSGEVYLDNLPS